MILFIKTFFERGATEMFYLAEKRGNEVNELKCKKSNNNY